MIMSARNGGRGGGGGGSASTVQTIVKSLPYRNAQRVQFDCVAAVTMFTDLAPQYGTWFTNHGEEQVLVALKGNVPTIYMGITYNTPLEVLIPRAFPAEPPVVYVRPTADMAIHSSHPIVDHGGRVAVTPWNAATRLVESIQHICLVFGSQPPLFKRASTTNTYQPQSLARTQNTQALRSRIESTLQSSMRRVLEQQRDAYDSELRLQDKLEQHGDQLQQGVIGLRDTKRALEQQLHAIGAQTDQVDEWLLVNAHTDVDDVPVDTLVVPSTVVGKQVLASVATAAAVDDALFLLTNALQEEVIGLPDFVQATRKLAVKQFEAKLMSAKCNAVQTAAGLR